jgi:hypothetical protein
VAEYFLGVPESREKDEVGTMMLVEKAEPEILRQSVQWHATFLGRLEGWRWEGGGREVYLVERFSFVGEGDFTAVAGSFAHC